MVSAETVGHFIDWMLDTSGLAYQYANQFVINLPSPRYEAYEENDY